MYSPARPRILFLFLGGAASQGFGTCPGFTMAAPPKNKKRGGRCRRGYTTLSLTPAANGRKIILVLPTPSRFNPPVSVIGLNGCRLGWPSLISMIVFNGNSQVGLHNPMQIRPVAKVNRARASAQGKG